MKTKEFIEEARDLGLFVDENKNQNMIWIKTPYEDNYVGEVKTDEIGCRIFDESKRFLGISKLIYEYGMTPVEKREEEKRYLVEIKTTDSTLQLWRATDGSGDTDFISKNRITTGQRHFTEKEIESIDDRFLRFAIEEESK